MFTRLFVLFFLALAAAADAQVRLIGDPVDPSEDFGKPENVHFVAGRVTTLDAQARASSERGHPMMRTLFFEFPDDPSSWTIEDEYMFGSDLLVAPMFEPGPERRVYLPPGSWVDYQSGAKFEGARWHTIKAGTIPVVLLVRGGALVPHAAVVQHTGAIDWTKIELRAYGASSAGATGLFALPDGDLHTLTVLPGRRGFALKEDPLNGRVIWQLPAASAR